MSTAEYERLSQVQYVLEDVRDILAGIGVLLSWTLMVTALYVLHKHGLLERLAGV